MPEMIFTRVLLPDPFSPTTAWISPVRTFSQASRSACVVPKRLARSAARSVNPVSVLAAGVVSIDNAMAIPIWLMNVR
jgi:hypothetical protein